MINTESLTIQQKKDTDSPVVGADETCDFLKRAGKEEKPFFMYIIFNTPPDLP